MKKITFMLLATFFATIAFAQKPFAKAEVFAKTTNETVQNIGIKTAPQGLSHKMMSAKSTRARAPRKAASAADLVGNYIWDYQTSSELSTDLESLDTSPGSTTVKITLSEETEGGITISGMFPNALEATVFSDEDDTFIVISLGQTAGTSSNGDYTVNGLFYYEGDEEYDAGWYNSDIYGSLQDDGTIYFPDWISRVLTTGDYAGSNLTPYYVGGSTLTPTEPLILVELPDGVEAGEYVMTYDGGSTPVKVAVNGNDVYFQGMSNYIPEAWVKGTKDGNIVTFPAMQYVGEAYGYTSFFFYNGETMFTYDAEADTYSAEGQVYGVLGGYYFDGYYANPVIAPVVEKAVMPANPEITSLENGTYGWYFYFNVPLTDIYGDPILASKLYYRIYTDTDGEIAPLTFTPATHTKLTENMTEIPYGFTESYDFYDTQIYLNDLYSEDWDKIGIQSIYYGGGETNATEIQWFDIAKNELVVLPEGVEAEEYSMFYEDSDGNSAAKTVNVAVDGSDVYIQGFSEYIPEAWVKGTRDGNVVTFPAKQYVGEYYGYESYAFYEGDAVFTYDAETDTYTAEGQVYGVLGDNYYDGNYYNPVIKKVIDKAAMPADPEITAMENGSYGWYIDFNVPTVDVNGDGLAIGKLAYMIYTDTQGTIAPLTFTPDTHTKLTEDMTEIPYGFTENYDFYADEIYLNDLYSADWTRIGIQSIYYGGGETNATEIQWFDILPEPELVVVPEGLETEAYLFSAQELENGDEEKWEDYTYQMQVGFDGSDVYFKGVSDDTADMWLKGTLSEDGKTVTIPANQYMGEISFWGYTFPYFFTAVAEDGETMEDIVLNYDAEASTFTTDQVLVLHDGKRSLGEPYQTFKDVVITKMQEFAATPADPSIDNYKFEGNYPYINFVIPAEDVDGNALLSSKLFYIVWIEEGGEEKPFVVHADEYKYIDEDITEIPYDYDDGYDIYKGGSKFYINPTDACTGWTMFGIQSIYYGGGERNASNIVWMDNPAYETSEVYTEFVEATGTLTYYYDNKKDSRSGVTELYDPNVVRFSSYYYNVTKAVIDPSMKDAELTSMKNMFFGGFDPETFDTYGLNYMTEIEGLENLNTSEVTDMKDMFYLCQELTSLDLSTFDTHKVTDMEGMFNNCTGLKILDITSFDVSNVTNFMLMFSQCTHLRTICCLGDWSGSTAQSDYMFYGCHALCGGEGTAYTDAVTDKTYARPDGGTESPGYFTADTMTGIASHLGETEEGAIYNLSGQRIAKAQKGINIVKQGSAKANGKKVLMK